MKSDKTCTFRLAKQSLGLEKPRRDIIHTDLYHLAGTWSTADAKALAKATEDFEKVDEGMWGS